VLRKESHQARKEVIVLKEVNLVRSVFERRVADEQQDEVHEVRERTHVTLRVGGDVHGVKHEQRQVESFFDLQDLPLPLFAPGEAAQESNEESQVVLHRFDVAIVLALRQNLGGYVLDNPQLHHFLDDVGGKGKSP